MPSRCWKSEMHFSVVERSLPMVSDKGEIALVGCIAVLPEVGH